MTAILKETIFDLAEGYRALESWLVETEGELTPELALLWDEWQGKFADKVENTALIVTEIRAKAKMIREQEELLAARRRGLEGKAEGLCNVLLVKMQEVGKTKVDGIMKTVAIQANPPRVEPLTPMDEAELRSIASWAPQYVRHEESWTLDKKKILEDAKAEKLDGDMAKRVQVVRTSSLRIR